MLLGALVFFFCFKSAVDEAEAFVVCFWFFFGLELKKLLLCHLSQPLLFSLHPALSSQVSGLQSNASSSLASIKWFLTNIERTSTTLRVALSWLFTKPSIPWMHHCQYNASLGDLMLTLPTTEQNNCQSSLRFGFFFVQWTEPLPPEPQRSLCPPRLSRPLDLNWVAYTLSELYWEERPGQFSL